MKRKDGRARARADAVRLLRRSGPHDGGRRSTRPRALAAVDAGRALRRRPRAADSHPEEAGKSSLLAGRGLYELIARPFAEVAVVVASRDQAAIILKQARGYIARSPALRRRLSVVQRQIRNKSNGGTMAVLAADSDTLDGWLGALALVDELGRWPSGENYGLLRAGVVPRDGQIIGISTASDDEANPLGKLCERAMALLDFRRDPDNPKH